MKKKQAGEQSLPTPVSVPVMKIILGCTSLEF